MSIHNTGTILDGKYEVLRALASGGFGEVVLVRHLHLEEQRVIKILRPEHASDPAAAQRFLRTARMATQIKHPNVAILHDYAQLPDTRFYMVWEYVEGEELGNRVERGGPLPVELAVELGIQTLRGLEAIHTAGIIHRDISPDNLLLTRDPRGNPRIKVIDLGLAKSLAPTREENLTESGMFMGKLRYCSPEQAGLEEGLQLDRRTDLYSFATVLYETICGKAPFESESPHGAVFLRLNEDPLPLTGRVPGLSVPASLDKAVLRGLAREREQRFDSAVAFIQALEEVRVDLRLKAAVSEALSPSRVARSEPSTPPATPEPPAPPERAERAETPNPVATPSNAPTTPFGGPRSHSASDSADEELLPSIEPLAAETVSMEPISAEPVAPDSREQAAEQLLDQHLDARRLPLARLALENLLDLVPNHPLRRDYKRQVKALADEIQQESRARDVLNTGREALARGDMVAAQRKLSALQRADPTGEVSQRFAREVAQTEETLAHNEQLEELTARFERLLDRGFLEEAEARLRDIAELNVSKVTLDLLRSRLVEARTRHHAVDVATRFEETFRRHLGAAEWSEAREVAFEMGRAVPSSERPAEMLSEISNREQLRLHSAAIEQGVRQVEALLEAGQTEQAAMALSVLKRMAPDHPKCHELEGRLNS